MNSASGGLFKLLLKCRTQPAAFYAHKNFKTYPEIMQNLHLTRQRSKESIKKWHVTISRVYKTQMGISKTM